MKEKREFKNDFHYRVNSVTTMKKLEEIMELKIYPSYNELINKCVDVAIDEILSSAKGKHEKLYLEHESKCDKLAHEVYLRAKQQDKKLEDIMLELLASQQILLSVFNIQVLEHKEKKDIMEKGLLTDKPKFLVEFYEDMTK